MNILFICSMGRYRSRTAAMCLKAAWNEVRYRGTDVDADIRVCEDDLADIQTDERVAEALRTRYE